jgi:CheY-like chemotaxis protein
MSTAGKHRILVVDDNESVRELFARMLRNKGYQVATADNGFDALLKLKEVVIPDVIISDLNMPKMSGFEFLSVVRRRFPKISVIASSGAYGSGAVPTGVLADAFFAKGEQPAEALLSSVAALIQTSAAQARAHRGGSAPVWIPRNGKDSNGIPYIVLPAPNASDPFRSMSPPRRNPRCLKLNVCFAQTRSNTLLIFLFLYPLLQGLTPVSLRKRLRPNPFRSFSDANHFHFSLLDFACYCAKPVERCDYQCSRRCRNRGPGRQQLRRNRWLLPTIGLHLSSSTS